MRITPTKDQPEAPSNNATSRNCELAMRATDVSRASERFSPRWEPGDCKARDSINRPSRYDRRPLVAVLVVLDRNPAGCLDIQELF